MKIPAIPPLLWLSLAASLFLATAAAAVATDPRVEQVRKDLGYYDAPSANADGNLESEIRALRDDIRQLRESQDRRLQRIEDALKSGAGKSSAVFLPPVPPPSSPVAPPPLAAQARLNPNSLTVCSQGCDFHDLQKAVDAAAPGGEIRLAAEINGTCAVIRKPLHIVGERGSQGRRTHLIGGVCLGKAPLVTASGGIVIEGLEISDVSVGDGNGACVRLDPGTRDLTLRDIFCHDSQDGVLGASAGLLRIEDSAFVGNGSGNGQAHGIYLNGGDEVVIRRSRFLSMRNAGHSIKSGARKLTIEDSIIAALNGHNSRALDAYAGGDILLRRNVIQQGPESDNSDMVGYGLEAARLLPAGHALRLEGNWLIFDNPNTRGVLLRGRNLGQIVLVNNRFVGLNRIGLDVSEDVGNRWFDNRKDAGLPPFDGTPGSLPAKGLD
jgi:hypothetical protein